MDTEQTYENNVAMEEKLTIDCINWRLGYQKK